MNPHELTEPVDDQHVEPDASIDRHVSRKRLIAGLPLALGALFFAKRPDEAFAGTDGDWKLSGNAVGRRSFLGTTNAKALLIKTKNVVRMWITANGDVGIGTSPIGAKLHVKNPGTTPIAVRGVTRATTGPTRGVSGEAYSTGGIGVLGTSPDSISTALNAIGVQGKGTIGVQGTGGYMGVQGNSVSYAVFGYTTPDTAGIAVYGRGGVGVKGRSYTGQAVLGDTDTGTGVKGEAYGAGGAVKAIHGHCFGSNGNGVVGEASVGTAAYGVWGISSAGYAGVFSGKALVTGTLSKGGGSFKIDHPLDPENKYLYHSFIESPDMMNVYNGNVTTDENGDAVVTLPDWFEALNRDFRYQLTVVGQFAQAMIASTIAGNRFAIKTDKPNVEVSWQVTGIRQDAFANKNRIPVEEDKKGDERGLFLHPKEHGKAAAMGVHHARLMEVTGSRLAREPDPKVPAAG